MKKIERDRLISRPKLSAAERRAANADRTRSYRDKMTLAGVPDRYVVAEALMQELLREAYSSWTAAGKDLSICEHRAFKKAMDRLLALKDLDGSPRYTKRGVAHRLDVVLADVFSRPRPLFDDTSTKTS